MKTVILSLLAAAALTLTAAQESPVTFRQIRNASLSPAQLSAVKTATLTYSVTGLDNRKATFTVRAKRFDQVRIDFKGTLRTFSSCRNGKEYWTYTPQTGPLTPSAAEIEEINQDIAFMPVPFNRDAVYRNPTLLRKEEVDGTDCFCFETTPISQPDHKILMWIDAKTRLLKKTESSDEHGCFVSIYQDYQDHDGIRLPSDILVSSIDGCFDIKLEKAEWNKHIMDSVFTTRGLKKITDPVAAPDNAATVRTAARAGVAEVKAAAAAPAHAPAAAPAGTAAPAPAAPAAKPAVKAAPSVPPADSQLSVEVIRPKKAAVKADPAAEARRRAAKLNYRRRQLEDKIFKLKLEIKDTESRMSKLETVFAEDRASATKLAAVSDNSGSWRYGWGVNSRSSHSSRTHRRAARNFGKESVAIAERYDSLSKKLIQQQLDLNRAQRELADLNRQK